MNAYLFYILELSPSNSKQLMRHLGTFWSIEEMYLPLCFLLQEGLLKFKETAI